MSRYYRVTRRKQISGRKYALVFEWSEGDPHILVSFKGRGTPFDTIGVFDHASMSATITGRDAFIGEVGTWLRTYHRDSITSAWDYTH